MKNRIFRWNGEYAGFVSNGYLFDAQGGYRGWVETDGRVWDKGGRYIGNLIEENYILRNTMRMTPMPRLPRLTPISPIPPLPPMNRIGRLPKLGWEDALESDATASLSAWRR